MIFAPVARADANYRDAEKRAAREPAVPPGVNGHLQNQRSAAHASPGRARLAASAVTWPGRAESVCDSGAGSRPRGPRGARSAAPGPCARSPPARAPSLGTESRAGVDAAAAVPSAAGTLQRAGGLRARVSGKGRPIGAGPRRDSPPGARGEPRQVMPRARGSERPAGARPALREAPRGSRLCSAANFTSPAAGGRGRRW